MPRGASPIRPGSFVLACLLAIVACGDGAWSVELAELRATPERYDGARVAVTGTLRSFDDPEHFWIENDELDRVGIEGDGTRPEDLRALVGWTVEVQGTFRFDRRAGRRIEVTAISSTR